MVTFREFTNSLRKLQIDPNAPVIVHSSLSAFGQVAGGSDTVLGSLLAVFTHVVMPTFTYKTMITPELGLANNGITYGSGKDTNRMAEFFRPDMPADRLMGVIPEALRKHIKATRSNHPLLSFAGIQAEKAIEAQTLANPLAPIRVLADSGGWVLLLGVDHTVNTSIHYAEKISGRKQFVRWALTPQGIQECPGFTGCSEGFQSIAPRLEGVTRKVQIGPATVQAVPLDDLIEITCTWLALNPLALLCDRPDCERCREIKLFVSGGTPTEPVQK